MNEIKSLRPATNEDAEFAVHMLGFAPARGSLGKAVTFARAESTCVECDMVQRTTKCLRRKPPTCQH